MTELARGIVFVKGACNGAIYDLVRNKVFSVNASACQILEKYINGEVVPSIDLLCLNALIGHNLIDKDYKPRPFLPEHVEESSRVCFDIVWLELTNKCNLKCVHCYQGHNHTHTNDQMELKDWECIVEQLAMRGIRDLVIIGGEPSLFPGVSKLLRYVSQLKISQTLYTNATFKDNTLKDAILESGCNIKVSLYGHNCELHDSITGIKGSFTLTCNNIRWFVIKGVRVHVAIILMKENQSYKDAIKDYVLKMGVKEISFDVIRTMPDGDQFLHTPTLSVIKNLKNRKKPCFKISKEMFIEAVSKNSCWNRKLAITAEGYAIPCIFARNVVIGNLKVVKLAELLQSAELRKCWNLPVGSISECINCEFRFACKDCRAMALAMKHNLYAKNPRCNYNPTKGIWEV